MTDPTDVVLKAFDEPDELREMTLGRFELITLGGRTIGRATYQPGWKWSEHVGPGIGQERCPVEHVGLVLSGTATAAFADGRVVELRAGFRAAACPVLTPLRIGDVSPLIATTARDAGQSQPTVERR